jgi:hypothetical protein
MRETQQMDLFQQPVRAWSFLTEIRAYLFSYFFGWLYDEPIQKNAG